MAKSVTLVSFSLLPFGGVFFFMAIAAGCAIDLPWGSHIEILAAILTLPHLPADDLGI